MPYLVSEETAEWLRVQKLRAGDLRSRPRRTRAADAASAPCPQWRITVEDGSLRVAAGRVVVYVVDHEAPSGDAAAQPPAVTPHVHEIAATDLGEISDGEISWRYGEDGGYVAKGAGDVLLGTVRDGVIDQLHIDTIFHTVGPDESEEPEDGGGGTDETPPCGHPGNGTGTTGVSDDAHPGDLEGTDIRATDEHPGDRESSDGATPKSTGDCP